MHDTQGSYQSKISLAENVLKHSANRDGAFANSTSFSLWDRPTGFMFQGDNNESNVPAVKQSGELPEKENLVGFFALLLEVDKRINGKAGI